METLYPRDMCLLLGGQMEMTEKREAEGEVVSCSGPPPSGGHRGGAQSPYRGPRGPTSPAADSLCLCFNAHVIKRRRVSFFNIPQTRQRCPAPKPLCQLFPVLPPSGLPSKITSQKLPLTSPPPSLAPAVFVSMTTLIGILAGVSPH